ncbi:hypothetical protein H5410_042506 [Solanum commersonii]|uniref:Uncharacterized protein n=1 Tax=Solanum commersonii TaxID=4109 RepID=A0A9J5XXP7_SOLCO|nr:hypothetical protein H5410_042506 [Solanum commersonii]
MVNINKAHDLQISSIVTVNKTGAHYVIKFEAFVLSSISGNLYIVCAFMECGLTGLAATSKFIGPQVVRI